MKKAIALGLAAVMFLVTGILTLAVSGSSATDYSVYMNGGNIEIRQNGIIVYSDSIRSSALSVLNDKNGDLTIQYKSDNGSLQNITLDGQKNLVVDGSFGLLDLRPSVRDDVWVVIPETAAITQLAVSAGHVELYGKVTLISAKSTKAHVQVMDGASVSRVNTVASSAVTGVPRSVRKSVASDNDRDSKRDRDWDDDDDYDYGYRSRYVDVYFNGRLIRSSDSITVGYSSSMGEASRMLDNACVAYDSRTGRRVSGVFRFDESSYNQVTDGWHSWTFDPNNNDYRRASGSMRIYVTSGRYNAVDPIFGAVNIGSNGWGWS